MTGAAPSQVQNWIVGQLAGVVPDWLRRMFFGDPVVAELNIMKGIKRIGRYKGQLVAPYSLLQPGTPDLNPVRNRLVDVYLPESFFLKRVIKAPSTARKNLNKLVELDMLRQTPFRPDTVYWALSKPQKSGSSQYIEQWIAKRTDVEHLQQRAENVGLRIRKIFIDGAPIQQPIADMSSSVTPNTRRWRALNGTLAIGILGLATMIWLYPAWQASTERSRLDSDTARNRTQALALRREVESLRTRETERAAFLHIVYQNPRLSQALRNLTLALPDEAWVSDMNFSTERLIVSGEISGSAAQLVLALAQRKEFTNPRLSGPVARANNGAEQFELTLDLAGAK